MCEVSGLKIEIGALFKYVKCEKIGDLFLDADEIIAVF